MRRLDRAFLLTASLGVSLASCSGDQREDEDTSVNPTLATVTATEGSTDSHTSIDPDSGDTGPKLDVGGDTSAVGCGNTDIGCTDQIDILFVIDNSGTMGEEQENLARNFPLLVEKLENLQDSSGQPVNADVQIMVTTTDFGNPLCTAFEKPDYSPARGAPISDACVDRLQRFTGLGQNPVMIPEACTNVCSDSLAAPEGDPFIAFNAAGDNIPDDVVPTDINGDGVPDSPVAQALACVGPQGIDGCGYEAPLENMLQALNPGKDWNKGPRPFLREGALLAIVIVTDEVDCSIKEYSVMEDPMYQETNPHTSSKQASSAICWNAGVTCNGPDANGVYTDCKAVTDDNLQPISRYTNYLIGELRQKKKKEVVMLGILGVPPVTEHNPQAPFQPTAGGVFDLVYRTWRDGQYPAGDILPDEFAQGVTAADKEFDFGIGPGCTGEDGMGGFTGQAVPPVRVKEVCEALNYEKNGVEQVRCCIESICDTDFSAAINCLTGIIQESITIPG